MFCQYGIGQTLVSLHLGSATSRSLKLEGLKNPGPLSCRYAAIDLSQTLVLDTKCIEGVGNIRSV